MVWREHEVDILTFNPLLAEYLLRNEIGQLILFSVEEYSGKTHINLLFVDLRSNRTAHAKYTKTAKKKQTPEYVSELLKRSFENCLRFDFCKEVYGITE